MIVCIDAFKFVLERFIISLLYMLCMYSKINMEEAFVLQNTKLTSNMVSFIKLQQCTFPAISVRL